MVGGLAVVGKWQRHYRDFVIAIMAMAHARGKHEEGRARSHAGKKNGSGSHG